MSQHIKARCHSCGGEVERLNPAWARRERERTGYGLREVARGMGITAGYLCDLELGRRPFSADLEKRFMATLESGGAKAKGGSR